MNNILSDIWSDFHSFYNEWIKESETSYHGWTNHDDGKIEEEIKEIKLNPYHLEGSVLNHTNAVTIISSEISETLTDDNDKKELIISALVHDLGKVLMRDAKINDKEEKKVHFMGHEYLSCFIGLPFLIKHFGKNQIILERIVTAIALHTMIYKTDIHKYITERKTFELLNNLGLSDHRGRIATSGEFNGMQWEGNERITDIISPNEKTVTVLIGLPGSGKSYFCDHSDYGKVFSNDEYLLRYADKEFGIRGNYEKAFQTVMESDYKWVQDTINSGFEYAKETEKNFVLDATNLVRKKRKSISRRAREQGYKVRFIMIWRDFDKLIKRRPDNKYISIGVYKRMIKSFSFPQIDEYDELRHVFVEK